MARGLRGGGLRGFKQRGGGKRGTWLKFRAMSSYGIESRRTPFREDALERLYYGRKHKYHQCYVQ